MTVELLPAVGVRLPEPLPELRFGMSWAEVRQLVATQLPVTSGWVCRCEWAASFRVAGCSVGVAAALGRGGLSSVSVWRNPDGSYGTYESYESYEQEAGAVVFLGYDLFGWPSDEIMAALVAEGQSVAPHGQNVWVGADLHLTRSPRPGARADGRNDARDDARDDAEGAAASRRTRAVAAARRKPRWQPPQFFDHVCLYEPGSARA